MAPILSFDRAHFRERDLFALTATGFLTESFCLTTPLRRGPVGQRVTNPACVAILSRAAPTSGRDRSVSHRDASAFRHNVSPMKRSRYRVLGTARFSRSRHIFLRSFAADLRLVGLRALVRRSHSRISFSTGCLPTHESQKLRLARRLKKTQATTSANFMDAVEQSHRSLLTHSTNIDIESIKPSLQLCETRADFALYNYCRRLQGVPNAQLVGRRMSWLVFDGAGSERRLMGAFGLSSSPFSLGSRDTYFGWKGSASKHDKLSGLLCLMDMPMCTALPPYRDLLGAKFIASLAITEEINAAFTRRYAMRLPPNGSLLAVVTLCATGIHCPIYNRIMLRPGGVFRRVGVTAGYSTAYLSNATLGFARQVSIEAGKTMKKALFAKSMRIVKGALESCGLPGEKLLRFGVVKGVYVGAACDEALHALRTNQYLDIQRPNLEQATLYWKQLVRRRLARAPMPAE